MLCEVERCASNDDDDFTEKREKPARQLTPKLLPLLLPKRNEHNVNLMDIFYCNIT